MVLCGFLWFIQYHDNRAFLVFFSQLFGAQEAAALAWGKLGPKFPQSVFVSFVPKLTKIRIESRCNNLSGVPGGAGCLPGGVFVPSAFMIQEVTAGA